MYNSNTQKHILMEEEKKLCVHIQRESPLAGGWRLELSCVRRKQKYKPWDPYTNKMIREIHYSLAFKENGTMPQWRFTF